MRTNWGRKSVKQLGRPPWWDRPNYGVLGFSRALRCRSELARDRRRRANAEAKRIAARFGREQARSYSAVNCKAIWSVPPWSAGYPGSLWQSDAPRAGVKRRWFDWLADVVEKATSLYIAIARLPQRADWQHYTAIAKGDYLLARIEYDSP